MGFRVEFRTREYEVCHFKQPRGTGYWLFDVHLGDGTVERVGFNGTLGETKREVREYCKRLTITRGTRISYVEVLP